MIHRLFKRWLVWKWFMIVAWRLAIGRDKYSLHDVPMTILRMARRYLEDENDASLMRFYKAAFTEIEIRKRRK